MPSSRAAVRFLVSCLAVLALAASAVAATPVARRVLVLFGHDPAETGHRPLWPPDTETAQHFQTPLEWMGYEADFRPVTLPLPKLPLDSGTAAVICDGTLKVPYAREEEFIAWLESVLKGGVRVVFVGDYPLLGATPRQRLVAALGLGGEDRVVQTPKNVALAVHETQSVMRGEMLLKPSPGPLTALTAPAQSQIFLATEGTDDSGKKVRSDAVYAAPWGGAALDPYVYRQLSASDLRQLLNPFAFLAKCLPAAAFPVPDPTTREGRRVFFSHIDGDGFTAVSSVVPDALNAEVIRDRILKKRAIPVTVSVVEANVRALDVDADPALRERYLAVAREIYALPNVQAATHTFSHPFVWIDSDVDPDRRLASPRNLMLRSEAAYPRIDPRREVIGSAEFIRKNLLPAGKPLELVLWSGNCRVPPEALAAAREAGLESLNGGNTIQSKRWPGRAGVAPRITQMGGELQIYAPNQNEMYYTDEWRSSFLGGFQAVRETFERTETPRRVKPVNIYYHFYSGERGDALAALETVHDWALERPLHATTALDWVRSVKAARDAVISPDGPRKWRVTGGVRTLRLPAGAGFPRVGLDLGVTGWNDAPGGERWLHTTGAKDITLELTDAAPAGAALRSSTAAVTWRELSAQRLIFTTTSLRAGQVELHLPGGSARWRVTLNGAELPAEKSAAFDVPEKAEITVQAR